MSRSTIALDLRRFAAEVDVVNFWPQAETVNFLLRPLDRIDFDGPSLMAQQVRVVAPEDPNVVDLSEDS